MVPDHTGSPGFQGDSEQARASCHRADEADRDRFALARDVERNLAVAEPHRAQALARDHAPRGLPGDPALALAQHVIDRGRDRGHDARGLLLRRLPVKAVGKFLGDEGGRELSRLPALVLHQRGEERDVVADALDREGVERVGLRVDRLGAASARG